MSDDSNSTTTRDVDAVIIALAVPVLHRLRSAAARLQPLSAAVLADLDAAIELELGQRIGAMRQQLAAMQAASAAEQAVWTAIDLPMGLRRAVQAARGAADAGEAA